MILIFYSNDFLENVHNILLAWALFNPVCQSTDSQAAVGIIVVHKGFCQVAGLIWIKMQVESVTSWMASKKNKPFAGHGKLRTL